jgi:(E)-4-hydroxy-3-methylbut-2-enyl-diphosphate synthase
LTAENIDRIKALKDVILVASSSHANPVGELRAIVHKLVNEAVSAPVIIRRIYDEASVETLRLKAAADLGVLLIDGLVDGVWIENSIGTAAEINSIAFGILQATRARISKTEYIACPGCGRTMYDLQGTLARIKAATAHLKGLKIGVMGCIVNGPGEMADADYGYVGAARGKVSLYRKKKNIIAMRFTTAQPASDAVREKIIAAASRDGAEVEMHDVVEPDIIGGFICETETHRLDASVRRQLRDIEIELVKQNRKLV